MDKQMIRLVILGVLLGFTTGIIAQEAPEGMVKYTPDYKFKDGIYPNFQTVKKGLPIPKTRLVTAADLFSRDFYEQVTEENKIVFYDDNGVQQELKTANIWGYARNGVLYINLGSKFHRLSFIGNIGHFVATLTTYNPGYYDPYYRSSYNTRYYSSPNSSYANTEVRQYLLDFETGKLHQFEVSSVEILLMKDPELYDEYMALSRKKKKQYKFVYIRKYNERNPLYFPDK